MGLPSRFQRGLHLWGKSRGFVVSSWLKKCFLFQFHPTNVCDSGQIVVTDPPMAETVSGNSSKGSGGDLDPFEFETELTLNETRVLLFLFTDAGKMDTGFNVSYW